MAAIELGESERCCTATHHESGLIVPSLIAEPNSSRCTAEIIERFVGRGSSEDALIRSISMEKASHGASCDLLGEMRAEVGCEVRDIEGGVACAVVIPVYDADGRSIVQELANLEVAVQWTGIDVGDRCRAGDPVVECVDDMSCARK